jgi:hypothetical protein
MRRCNHRFALGGQLLKDAPAEMIVADADDHGIVEGLRKQSQRPQDGQPQPHLSAQRRIVVEKPDTAQRAGWGGQQEVGHHLTMPTGP